MPKPIVRIAAHPFRAAVILAIGLAVMLVAAMSTSATPPSAFMEGGTSGGDANVRHDATNPVPPYDWANGPSTTVSAGPCTLIAGVVSCPGVGGLFDGGVFNGATTDPTPPNYIGPGSGSPSFVTAAAFIADSLGTDVGQTAPGTTTVCGKGDVTVYTGAGGEKNGDPLNGKGVETYAQSSVPAKDELSNVYAIARKDESTGLNEIFFGAERIVNNGDSHIDFEFLQQPATLVNVSACSSSLEGKFDGHRSQGDIVASIEYTKGGALGGFELNQWHCNLDTSSSDAKGWVSSNPQASNGTVCDPGGSVGTGPHYQLIACLALPGATACPSPITPPTGTQADAIKAVTNGSGPVDSGGWVSRDTSGNRVSTIDTNELMEGGINLASLGFQGCLSTFLPHTRSSQAFTATLKDFALQSFNSCRPTTALTVSPSASQLVHAGDSVPFTFNETNDGNVSLTSPRVDVTVSPSGPTGCGSLTTPTSGDTNGNGILNPGETWVFTCTETFPTAGVFTVTGTAHGTFQGEDITFPGDPDEQTNTTVRVISPATTLLKSASPTTIHSGDTVTYTYTETNGTTGGNLADRDISGVSISDNKCSPLSFVSGDTNSDTKLNPGETWTFTCSVAITTAATSVTNTATASGTDALGSTVTWCAAPGSPPANTICSQTEQAQATVTVIHPATTLDKTPLPVATVTYSYTESNTGDVPLTSPSVSDDKCSPVVEVKSGGFNTGDSNANGILDVGETWNFACTTTNTLLTGAGSTSVQNTATAHATDQLGTVLTETVKATVSVTIGITKP